MLSAGGKNALLHLQVWLNQSDPKVESPLDDEANDQQEQIQVILEESAFGSYGRRSVAEEMKVI